MAGTPTALRGRHPNERRPMGMDGYEPDLREGVKMKTIWSRLVLGMALGIVFGGMAGAAAAAPAPAIHSYRQPGRDGETAWDVMATDGSRLGGKIALPQVQLQENMVYVHGLKITSRDARILRTPWTYADYGDPWSGTGTAEIFGSRREEAERTALHPLALVRDRFAVVYAAYYLLPRPGERTVHLSVDGHTLTMRTPPVPAGSALLLDRRIIENGGPEWFGAGGVTGTITANRPIFHGPEAISAYRVDDRGDPGGWQADFPARPVGTLVYYHFDRPTTSREVFFSPLDPAWWAVPPSAATTPLASSQVTVRQHGPGGRIWDRHTRPVDPAASVGVAAAAAGAIWILVAWRRRRRWKDGQAQ